MIRYLLFRVLWLVPTLVLVTMFTFFLASGSQSQKVIASCANFGSGSVSPDIYYRCIREEQQRRGLNKAPFFVSIHPLSEPDTLYLIFDPLEKTALRQLSLEIGDPDQIYHYRQQIIGFLQFLTRTSQHDSLHSWRQDSLWQASREIAANLLRTGDLKETARSMDRIAANLELVVSGQTVPEWVALRQSWQQLSTDPNRWRTWIPRLSWHGFDNQYVDWLAAVVFRLDFGKNDANLDVIQSIRALLPRTMLFAGLGIFLSFLMAIPLAMWSARHAGSKRDRALSGVLFMLDSIPSFWLALMLLFFLADPEYLGWFPSSWRPDDPIWQQVHSMILPLLVYINGSLAFLTRTLRASILEIRQESFVQTARSLGYSERRILWRHVLRPALLPMITVIGAVFPVLISGSVILEELFNINGLGYTILKSTLTNEQNVVLAVFTLSSLLTLLGYFVSDLLYAWADPRIRFRSPSTSGS